MSHIVLARKYRPKSFEEVIGQDNSVLILQSFISNDSIPHSLIFCGGRGVGKTSMARIFAKAINSDEISKNPLLAKDIDNGKSLDVIEIDYENKLMGGGFKINNPNASSSCGCGESFA